MSIKFSHEKESMNKIVAAMKTGNEDEIQQAWQSFHDSVVEQVKADFEELQESNDSAVLAKRGYRQLTSKEKKWYQKVITALKSVNPKQAFTAIIGSDNEEDLMPTTIIEDVYRDLKEEYPRLNAINFQNVGYLTKWVLNDHATQNAVWGTITDEIAKEITSAFRVVDINQSKLDAFLQLLEGYEILELARTGVAGLFRGVDKVIYFDDDVLA